MLVRSRDEVTAYRVGLEDALELSRAGPQELDSDELAPRWSSPHSIRSESVPNHRETPHTVQDPVGRLLTTLRCPNDIGRDKRSTLTLGSCR